MDPSDLDEGGVQRQVGQFWLGPSTGWTPGYYGTLQVTSGGVTNLPLGITIVEVNVASAGPHGHIVVTPSILTVDSTKPQGTNIGALSVVGGTGVYTCSLVTNPSSRYQIIANEMEVGTGTLVVGTDQVLTQCTNGAGDSPELLIPIYVISSPFGNFDPSRTTQATLSNSNLTVTAIAANGGSFVFTSEAHTTGKYYFELTWATMGGFIGGGEVGVAVTTATQFQFNSRNVAGIGVQLTQGDFSAAGSIWANGVRTSFHLGGTGLGGPFLSAGMVFGFAIDLDNRTAWIKVVTPSFLGNFWNGNASANPATNVNGVTIPAGSIVPAVGYGTNADTYIANFGDSAFIGTVPTGFTAGWPQ